MSTDGLDTLRFGPAGWDYKDWYGKVYPKPKPKGFDPLRFIAHYFDTLEVNSTFYRPMAANTASSWVERVGENRRFRFTMKLWQRFTHERKTAWTKDELGQAMEAMEVLSAADKLGAVLLQFPWSFRNDEKNREWLHDVINAFAAFPLVLEVRHQSWNTPGFYEDLTELGVGFVNIDQPLFKNSIKPSARATAPVGYVRIHGRNYADWFREEADSAQRYNYLYSAEELQPWAERIRDVAASARTQETYVVTNNHFVGKAPANALMLQSMVTGQKPPAPPELIATYPDVLSPFARPEPFSGSP